MVLTLLLAVQARADVTPEMVRGALSKLDYYAQQAMKETGIPGMAIGVVYRDQVIFLKGYGVREEGEPGLVDPDTVFLIASVSKPITSTIIARAVTEKVVNWDDRIQRYLPGFALANKAAGGEVTLRDMLSHRSGLPDHAGDLLEDLGFDRTYILSRLKAFPLENRFRARYQYTNYGITSAGEAVAAAYGISWEQLAEEKLFLPLGMRSTSSRYNDYLNASNRAIIHSPKDPIKGGPFLPLFERNPQPQSPAGGVSASARDLSTWVRLHLANGEIDGEPWIGPAALAETYRPHMLTDFNPNTLVGDYYGLCWGVSSPDRNGYVYLRHSGEFFLGARSIVSLLPGEELGILVLVNAAPSGVPEAMSFAFYDYALRGELSRDWIRFANDKFALLVAEQFARNGIDYTQSPQNFVPRRAFDWYTGVYDNPVYDSATIFVLKNRIYLTMGPDKMTWELRHYSGDLFYYETTGENRTGLRGVSFDFNQGHKASSVTINTYNAIGLGNFTRRRPL
ncbi:MAG: serine hydrolase [Methylococcales bacterium]